MMRVVTNGYARYATVSLNEEDDDEEVQNHSELNGEDTNTNGGHNGTASTTTDASNRKSGNGSGGGFIYPLELGYDDDDDDASPRSDESVVDAMPLLQPIPERDKNLRRDEDAAIRLYGQRWVQLLYLSVLALLSDWICFATAAVPESFERAVHGTITSPQLIDMFLFTNVASCFCVTDMVARFGLRRCVQASAVLMAAGCWLRGGVEAVASLATTTSGEDSTTTTAVELASYWRLVVGTLCVGAAQPFFQCTPPLLSAQWFAEDERATSTAVALNFNQVGIATAFLVGSRMGTSSAGLRRYFGLLTALCTITALGTLRHFQNLPERPPSASELEKRHRGHPESPFSVSVRCFFSTPGFSRPLMAFICSIAITNVVGAFIDEVLERGGMTNHWHMALAGVGFEMAILFGGVVLGGYVDRTKAYKTVTLWCLGCSMLFVLPLGLTEHALGKEPVLLVVSLWALGFVAGPIQPINAELAVDVVYPGDETAVESVQQIGGNLVSALLVPLAERAGRMDYEFLQMVPLLNGDVRGDVLLLLLLTVWTYSYYRLFDSPLRRTNLEHKQESRDSSTAASDDDDDEETAFRE